LIAAVPGGSTALGTAVQFTALPMSVGGSTPIARISHEAPGKNLPATSPSMNSSLSDGGSLLLWYSFDSMILRLA
jgi:hypothetical protein